MNELLTCDLLNDSFLLRMEQYYLKYLLLDNEFLSDENGTTLFHSSFTGKNELERM